MSSYFARLAPFIALGIIVVFFIVGIVLLSYLLIFGALVGLVLFALAWIRDRFLSKKDKSKLPKKTVGRTIDHK